MRQGNYTEDTLRAAKIGLEKGHLEKKSARWSDGFFWMKWKWLMFFLERDADRGFNDV